MTSVEAVPVGGSGELVRRAAAGDGDAWADLVAKYTPFLYRIARGYRLSPAVSGDVVQTAWLRLVQHIEMLDKPEAVGSWLATTARRESLKQLRAGQRECQLGAGEYDLPDHSRSPEEEAVVADTRALLAAALGRIPDRDRRLLLLLTASPSVTYAEISAALDMPVGSIGPTRARTLSKLRHELHAADAGRDVLI